MIRFGKKGNILRIPGNSGAISRFQGENSIFSSVEL